MRRRLTRTVTMTVTMTVGLALPFGGAMAGDTGMEIFLRLQKQRFFEAERDRIIADPAAAQRRYLGVAFRQDPDGHVSQAAVDRRARFDRAQARAQAAGQMLKYDLDADGRVSTGEIDELALLLTRPEMAKVKATVLAADRNGDGALSIDEMLASPAKRFGPRPAMNKRHEITVILGMDLDSDGVTTPEEIVRAIDMLANAAGRQADE